MAISTSWEQHAAWSDTRRVVGVQVPILMTGEDYVAGRDPVLEHILESPSPYPTVIGRLRSGDPQGAADLFQAQREKYGDIDWWEPFTEVEMNRLGYDLLQTDPEIAVTAFKMNTVMFPRSWNVWDSLGDGLMALGQNDDAASAFLKALTLDPTNWNSSVQRERVRQLSSPRN